MAFSFEKPEGFSHRAGQSIDITLINPPETDQEGNTRAFSLVSTPEENNLVIATRMRDTAFKRVLKTMQPGTEVEITEALGSFTLHNDTSKPAVFLTGGIGITPVRSIIKDATNRNLPHELFLFYSNKRPQDAAFLAELEELADKNPKFTLIPTMTDLPEDDADWTGERGYITAEMIKQYFTGKDAVWYLTGPAGMVKAMREVLGQLQADEDFIRTEEFAGY